MLSTAPVQCSVNGSRLFHWCQLPASCLRNPGGVLFTRSEEPSAWEIGGGAGVLNLSLPPAPATSQVLGASAKQGPRVPVTPPCWGEGVWPAHQKRALQQCLGVSGSPWSVLGLWSVMLSPRGSGQAVAHPVIGPTHIHSDTGIGREG